MAGVTSEALRKLADQLEDEDRSAALEARLRKLEERSDAGATITTAQIVAALEQASDEELEALHGTVLDRLAREVEDRRDPDTDDPPADDPPADDPPADDPPADDPPDNVRPGRKQGQAYNWTTDDEGRVVQLDMARIWNEPDEDDEVPVPPPADDDGEES